MDPKLAGMFFRQNTSLDNAGINGSVFKQSEVLKEIHAVLKEKVKPYIAKYLDANKQDNDKENDYQDKLRRESFIPLIGGLYIANDKAVTAVQYFENNKQEAPSISSLRNAVFRAITLLIDSPNRDYRQEKLKDIYGGKEENIPEGRSSWEQTEDVLKRLSNTIESYSAVLEED